MDQLQRPFDMAYYNVLFDAPSTKPTSCWAAAWPSRDKPSTLVSLPKSMSGICASFGPAIRSM